MRTLRGLLILAVLSMGPGLATARADWTWYEIDADRSIHVNLYLFWSSTCPHCPAAKEFVNDLQQRRPWVRVYAYEVSDPANRELYRQMAASLNRPAGQTPAFFYCKQLQVGYGSYPQTGRRIENELVRWYDWLKEHQGDKRQTLQTRQFSFLPLALMADGPPEPPGPPELPPDVEPAEETVHLPGLGDVEVGSLSLPALTVVLAGCDALNPCAFFVLLMLLSLLVHGHSRMRMLIVGGTFVFFSGFMYFLFMAAWLNLFFLVGQLRLITAIAGALAIAAASLNMKDFFWPHEGASLSIPGSAKPGLFQRMTKLINVSSLPSLLAGSAALAFAANLYELLCTSGFPMVYTRVLTLRNMPTSAYYLYLVAYNVIYVLPMALIVLAFVRTLGSRKLTEYEGRALKLLSGCMLLALGLVLIVQPGLLNSLLGAVGLLAAAVGLTALILFIERVWSGRPAETPTIAHGS